MSRMSRTKGNVAEREVAALIQTWWRQLEPKCQYIRTPSSGGWSTPEIRSAFNAAGDLMTDAKRWPFSVEVKRREGWNLRNFVLGKRSPAWSWWRQCQHAAVEMDAAPMLWLRQSRSPWIVVVPSVLAGHTSTLAPDVVWAEPQPGSGVVHPVGFLADRLLATEPRFLRWMLRVLKP
jgi:hypothetical protein